MIYITPSLHFTTGVSIIHVTYITPTLQRWRITTSRGTRASTSRGQFHMSSPRYQLTSDLTYSTINAFSTTSPLINAFSTVDTIFRYQLTSDLTYSTILRSRVYPPPLCVRARPLSVCARPPSRRNAEQPRVNGGRRASSLPIVSFDPCGCRTISM